MGSSSSVLQKLDYQYSNEYDTYEEDKEQKNHHEKVSRNVHSFTPVAAQYVF